MSQTQTQVASCGFAWPGTYGHECGAPAVLVGKIKSDTTRTGIYFARRCEACAAIKGGENAGLFGIEKYDPAAHVNQWK